MLSAASLDNYLAAGYARDVSDSVVTADSQRQTGRAEVPC